MVTTTAELAANSRAYSGLQVKVAGTLRSYPEPLHFWIEDTELNRVAVEFHEPLEPLVGQRIEVQGRFSYQLSAGRRITVDRLTTAPVNSGQ